MTTTIRSNGSKWSGEKPDSLDALFQRLEEHPLDRSFEDYGNFITIDPQNTKGEPMTAPGGALFFGNFFTYSHVFHIETDEPELIAALTRAIRENQQRPDYLDQPPPFHPGKLAITRHRFSTTQGEVELAYDGVQLGRFGDKITMNCRGEWTGLPDAKWFEAARHALTARHVKDRSALSRKAS